MKAITFSGYNTPLQVSMLPVPRPAPDEVLVKVRAVSVNDFDWALTRGKPDVYRLIFGLMKPRIGVPGIELSGIVEKTGDEVARFKTGDRVYGDISGYTWGAFAEYICVKQHALHVMSSKMTFEEAAALPHAGMLALQGLVDVGNIQKGEKVLINGAGGGVGTLGIQLAKLFDAEVTGVDGAHKFDMMKSLGFDFVIDYKEVDFTRSEKQYDLILDAKTTRPPSAYQRVLSQNGRYITVGGHAGKLVLLSVSRLLGRRNLKLVTLKPNKDLQYLNDLYDEGRLKPILDRPFKLEDAAEAIRYFGEGKHLGKVVITIS